MRNWWRLQVVASAGHNETPKYELSGLGQLEAVQEVCSLIQLHRPVVAFLSETRLFSNDVQGLRMSLGFSNGVGVGSYSQGGLALLWSNDVCVKVQTYVMLHIDVMVVDPSSGVERWRFIGFYGEARRELRHRSWELMQFLNA
jgi:hypothetical protein